MAITIYLYGKCSTCKDALRFLKERGQVFTVYEIKEKVPTAEELARMLDYHQGEVSRLFNTSGQLYREMGLSEKLSGLTVEEAFRVLQSDGMLIKRPFLLADHFGLLGFKEDRWKRHFDLL